MLAELQHSFVAAILDAGQPPPRVLEPGRSEAHRLARFNIYRNNFYAGMIDVLQARFPVVTRLLGEEFFRASARVFVEQSPPQSSFSLVYGAAFPAFLADFPPVADVPYLSGVAALEWARHESRYSADAATVDAAALDGWDEGRIAGATFALHPSLRVIGSRYPIVSIWETNTYDTNVRPIAIGDSGEDAIVARPGSDVLTSRLPNGGAEFVAALRRESTLGTAFDTALEACPQFDLQAVLTSLLACGGVIAIRCANS